MRGSHCSFYDLSCSEIGLTRRSNHQLLGTAMSDFLYFQEVRVLVCSKSLHVSDYHHENDVVVER